MPNGGKVTDAPQTLLKMTDLEIIEQLYKGNHLNESGLKRANQILHGLRRSYADQMRSSGTMGKSGELQEKLLKQVELLDELARSKEYVAKTYHVVQPDTTRMDFGLYWVEYDRVGKEVAWGDPDVIKAYLRLRGVENQEVMDIHLLTPVNTTK